MKPLVIRADASSEIGTGHIMRCLALAEAWQECGGTVLFVLASSSPVLEKRLSSELMGIQHIKHEPGSSMDANETVKIAQEFLAGWVVVDGYHFGAEYQKIIKESGLCLLFIDDFGHADHYYADIVLNQNIYADLSLYKSFEPKTRFLLGTNYVLLRKEFLKWVGFSRDIPDVARKILITFGGADPHNNTLGVINTLKQAKINDLVVIAVIGGNNPHYETLCKNVKDFPNFSIRKNVDNMPEIMAWADAAISAGGTTCWELAFMGLPTLVHAFAENQNLIVKFLVAQGMADELTIQDLTNPDEELKKISELLTSKKRRAAHSHMMRCLIDGEGSSRVTMIMAQTKVRLRNVRESDCDIIFQWINDPVVRVHSFHQHFITYEEHKDWFFSVIRDSNSLYFIAVDTLNHPIGQARFKIESGKAVISVLVEPVSRNKGLGSLIIDIATRKLFHLPTLGEVNAFIKKGNESSLKAFTKAGYSCEGYTIIENQEAYHLKRKREE